MREVRWDSLKDLGEYLGLDYTPTGAKVEDWGGFTDEGFDEVESLDVEWSDGIQIYGRECTGNLDYLINNIIYEEEKKKKKEREFIVTYRNEFEAKIKASSPEEAIKKFQKGECKIEKADFDLWEDFFEVYTEDGEEIRAKAYC